MNESYDFPSKYHSQIPKTNPDNYALGYKKVSRFIV